MKLFDLGAGNKCAAEIARCLRVELAAHEERKFEDGEFKIRPLANVRGEHAFVYDALQGDGLASANDKLCRLLFFVGALHDAGAARVTAVVPYLAYARKDRRTKPNDPVTIRYVAQMFESVGVDALISADVHNPAAFDNAFRCVKVHVETGSLFAKHFLAANEDRERTVVLSPDAGGVKRARALAAMISATSTYEVELAFMEKQRSEGRVSGSLFAGDVEGARVIVIDDLISGGTTMARAARASIERGASAVHAAATHGVFGTEAAEMLAIPELASIVVTDTVGDVRSRCPAIGGKLAVLETAELLAGAIRDCYGRG